MALITKPDVTKIWASTPGAAVAPPDAKITSGWGLEMMPAEWENFLQNRTDLMLNHISQRGIAEWDAITEYQANKSYVTGSNGVVYLALTTHQNINPTTDSGTNWTRAFPSANGGGASGTWGINVSGSAGILATARTISLTGDVIWTSPGFNGAANVSNPATLSNTGVAAGTYNNVATQLRPFTVDAKGRITGVGSAITITPDWVNIAGKPTTASGFGITDVVVKDSDTGSAQLPAGTTAERSANGAGKVRFNTTVGRAEINSGTSWGSLGGASGGGADAVFYLNDQTVNNSYTIPAGQNAMSSGPITIADGVVVSISDGSVWTII